MLWSLSGTLGLVYKGLFGMDFQAERLVFQPFVPQALQGTRRLRNFRYRQAKLDIELSGYGRTIRSITLDGQPLPNAAVSSALSGSHSIRIELTNEAPAAARQNKVAHHVAPMTPPVTNRVPGLVEGALVWKPVEGARAYQVLHNGRFAARTTETRYALEYSTGYHEYQVLAVDAQGYESFASEPLVKEYPAARIFEIEKPTAKPPKPYQGYSGKGFVEISKTQNKTLAVPVTVAEAGLYAVAFRYANGNGPLNTSNKCAIRTLRRGRQLLGTVVLPQRGVDEWSDWGFSNPVLVRLEKGLHPLTLTFEAANENMNGEVNQALLDYLRLTRID